MGKIALTDFAVISKNESYQKANNFASCNLLVLWNRLKTKMVVENG